MTDDRFEKFGFCFQSCITQSINQLDDKIDENIHNYLYKIKIYISGEISNCDNSEMISYLRDNYDLDCHESKFIMHSN